MITSPAPVRLSDRGRLLAVFGPALIVLLFGALAYWGGVRERASRRAVDDSHRVIEASQRLLTRLVDAETGQRGYLLTGSDAYLTPYHAAESDVESQLARLRRMTLDSPVQQASLDSLGILVDAKFREMEATVALRRAGPDELALQTVTSGIGMQKMDAARRMVSVVQEEELSELAVRSAQAQRYSKLLFAILVLGTATAALVSLLLNRWMDRYAMLQREFAASLEQANGQLQAQRRELEAQNGKLQLLTDELAKRTDAAEAANRAKASFLASMSHDVRTPLNAILGYVDLLEMGIRGPVTPGQMQDLRRIRASGTRLLALINDILSFARLEAGKIEIRLESVALAAAIHQLEASFLPQVSARGLTYRNDGCDPALLVRADPERMGQIVLNLVTNAFKFTDPGGEIEISCVADGEYVAIRVRDTGRGIPADRLSTIFEPFVQVDRERTEQASQGVGLGLAISRELARAMGGELTVESAPGRGSCFTLDLPRAAPSDAGAEDTDG
jgi:signal transduction histidine kinase